MAMKLQMKQDKSETKSQTEDKSCVLSVCVDEEMYKKIKEIAKSERTTVSYETKLIIMKFVMEYDPFYPQLKVKAGNELRNMRFESRKRFGVKIDKYYNDRLKDIAYQNETSMSEVIRSLIKDYINEYEKSKKDNKDEYSHALIEEKPFEMYIDLA